MLLDVKLKGLPNEELVQGYPGIPATWPRIAATVELRYLPTATKEPSRQAFQVNTVSVALLRTDSVVIPSHRPSVAAQKCEKSFLVTRQKEIYRGSRDECFAIDIPFTLSLPTNKTPCASISLSKALESSYQIYVSVDYLNPTTNTNVVNTFPFPIRIRRFDTLATFGIFNKPIQGSMTSSDHLVSLEWSLPVSAYGPGDKMSVSFCAQPNHDWPKSKKVKVKRFSLELLQITHYRIPKEMPNQSTDSTDGATETIENIKTRTRITKTAKSFNAVEQEKRLGLENSMEIELKIPSILHSENPSGVLPKEPPAIGFSGLAAFTNESSLYSIEFKLILKARFSNAKDIEAEQPITISQFDHYACMAYMNSLVEAAQRLKYLDPRAQKPRIHKQPLDMCVKIL